MATYNSNLYNIETGANNSVSGSQLIDAKFDTAKLRTKIVTLNNTNVQALNSGDVVNLCILRKGSVVTSVTLLNDTATTSGTAQVGVSGTAGFFSTAGLSIATANTRQEAFTNQANVSTELTQDQVVILTLGGANVAANTTLKVIIYYTRE